MTLVVPCLDKIFMVLLISELAKIGATKPIFLDSGSPRGGGGGSCVCGCGQSSLYMQVLHFTILNQSKNTVFFLCNIDLRRTMLPNYLGTYSSALCQI